MTRMFNALSCLAAASALAVTIACSGSPGSPAAPAASVTGHQDANPDGSTLKVNPPALVSPMNDLRLDTRQPSLVANVTTGLYANRAFSYEFELMNDAGARIAGTTIAGGSGATTTWNYPQDLERDTPYRWRVRARLDARVGPWSSTGRFLTVKENRTPNPASGRLPFPSYGAAVVAQVAAQRADLLFRSCQEHGGTWEFMDLVVDTLRLRDTRWGYNGKRGNPNDPSLDVVAYNWGSQPDQGTTQVYIIDVIAGHCGDSPSPTFLDMTQITLDAGFTGVWTSRGRFPGSSGVN